MADWLNYDLSDYIDKKEKIVVDTRRNDRVCKFSSYIASLFLSLFFAFFISVFCGIVNNFNIGISIFVFLFSYPLFVCLVYISQRSIRYVLTNNGIYEISGLIFKNVKFVAYNQITDVSMSRGPLERIVGAGSVGVGTASGNIVGSISDGNGSIQSQNELDINSVDSYKKIREVIIKNRKK